MDDEHLVKSLDQTRNEIRNPQFAVAEMIEHVSWIDSNEYEQRVRNLINLKQELNKTTQKSRSKDMQRDFKIMAGHWNIQFEEIELRMEYVIKAMCGRVFT